MPVQLLMGSPTTASKRYGPEKRSSRSCAGIMRLAGGKAVPAKMSGLLESRVYGECRVRRERYPCGVQKRVSKNWRNHCCTRGESIRTVRMPLEAG